MNALRLLNSKGVHAIEDTGLWPEPMFSGSGKTFSPALNYMVFNKSASWHQLRGMKSLFDCFHSNPILYAVVMIKAREYANVRIQVMNKRSGVIEDPLKTRPKQIPDLLYTLFRRPNVLQSQWEFFQQAKIFEEVAGNAFTYGNSVGATIDPKNIVALWNIWPQCMEYKLAGNYFEATRIEEVIAGWQFRAGEYTKSWKAHEILHKNKPNTEVYDGLIFGRSTAQSLVKPLSNIDMAYESRNVIMGNRGMSAIISSAVEDRDGLVQMQPEEEETVHEKFKGYGTLKGQRQYWFSPYPLNVTHMPQNVADLGLFEEISSDAMIVSVAYGVPEILTKLYVKGTSYENQEASVRRLYQGTLIPEAEDYFIALNYFLGLHDSDWVIVPSFAHVAVLQESEEKKEATRKLRAERMIAEISAKVRTRQEYRDDNNMGPLPKELEEESPTTNTTEEPAQEEQPVTE